MAGYKESLLKLKPDCFITFDGDTLFDSNGYLRQPHIPDVSNNENHALVHAVSDEIKSYAMGIPSLVDRENGMDQYAFAFASRGNTGEYSDDFPYPPSKLEIFHSSTLKCEDEFTFSFIFQKTDRDSWFRSAEYNYVTGKYQTRPGLTKSLSRTIFQKGSDVWMRWRCDGGWYQYDHFDFKFPGPAVSSDYTFRFSLHSQNYTNILNTSNYTQRQIHVVMTRRKLKVGSSLYQTIDSVYLDGIKYFERKSQITNEPSTALNTASIFIGGTQDPYDYVNLNDRQTTPLYIDNFAVFNNRCLTDDEVSWLYKKMYSFTKYTKRWDPQLFIEFAESTLRPNVEQQTGVIATNKNNATLTYIGQSGTQIIPGVEGPKRLIYTPAMRFQSSGMARIASASNNYTSPVLTVSNNQDYTLELFVAFTSNKKGVIFSAQTDTWPYKGILIEANVSNQVEKRGSIQVSLEDGLFLNSNNIDAFGNDVLYNDGQFHHISVIRRNSNFELWIDGVLHGSRVGNNGSINDRFGQIYLMNSMPENNEVTGALTNLAFFTYAMQPSNIRSRSYFFTRTVVEGFVTLRGVPHPATVRCFERTTGQFVAEDTADPNTGWYQIDVWTENYMDVMFFDLKNPQVRPRALGPYLAYEYTDIDTLPL